MGTWRFQCSSASRKFLNYQSAYFERGAVRPSFSALQRAENSSIAAKRSTRRAAQAAFQCSSASRKFLNQRALAPTRGELAFQCSSASRKFLNTTAAAGDPSRIRVSVLFSEPKIPQFTLKRVADTPQLRFSALQRAENSSIRRDFG